MRPSMIETHCVHRQTERENDVVKAYFRIFVFDNTLLIWLGNLRSLIARLNAGTGNYRCFVVGEDGDDDDLGMFELVVRI